MNYLKVLVFLLGSCHLAFAQFPSLKGKNSSGIFSQSQISRSDGFGFVDQVNFEATEARFGLKRTIQKYGQTEDESFIPADTIHTFELGLGLSDFIYNPISSDKGLEVDFSYHFSFRPPIELSSNIKKTYSSIKPFISISQNKYVTKGQGNNLIRNKNKTHYSFGIDISETLYKESIDYQSGLAFSIGMYLGFEVNSIGHLPKFQFCELRSDSLILDSSVLDSRSCSELAFGESVSSLLGKIKFDLAIPLTKPESDDIDPNSLPRLYLLSRISYESMPSIEEKFSDIDLSIGLSFAKSDRVPLATFLLSIKELFSIFRSNDNNMNIEEESIKVQVAVPIGRA